MPEAPGIDDGIADGTYKEALVPPLSGGCDEQGEFVNAAYYVPFQYRHDFIKAMVSPSEYSGGSGAPPANPIGVWVPQRPYSRPEMPGLYAFACQWESTGTIITGGSFETSDVLMKVQFRTPMWPIGGDSGTLVWDPLSIGGTFEEQQALLWATQNVESNVEYIERPQGSMFLEDYPGPGEYFLTDVPEPVPLSISDIYITYMRVPYYPAFLEALKDTPLNESTFLGCQPGTLYFAGYTTEMKSWVGGFRTRSVTLHLRKRPNGITWNHRLGPDGGWYLMRSAPALAGNLTFESGNFNKLLLLGNLAA